MPFQPPPSFRRHIAAFAAAGFRILLSGCRLLQLLPPPCCLFRYYYLIRSRHFRLACADAPLPISFSLIRFFITCRHYG